MAYALVGALGTAVQSTSGGSASPAYGQTPTAGNLLVFWRSQSGSASPPAGASLTGWSLFSQFQAATCSVAIYLKVAVGADAAPTTGSTAAALNAGQLGEFSGGDGTNLNNDQTGTGQGTTSPVVGTAGGLDATTGQLILMCGADFRSVARAPNDTWTSNSGTVTQAGSNNGTSSTNHYSFGYILSSTQNASADTVTLTLSVTTSITGIDVCLQTVKLPAAAGGDVGFPIVGGGYYGFREYAQRARRRFWRTGWTQRPTGVLVPQ